MSRVLRSAVVGDLEALPTDDKPKPPLRGFWLTSEEDGKPVAMLGLLRLDESRGLMMYTTAVKSPFLFRSLLKAMLSYPPAGQFARLEAAIAEENWQMRSLVEWFGFVDETPRGMEKFIGGKNYHLYARVS